MTKTPIDRIKRYLHRSFARDWKVSVIVPVYEPGEDFDRCLKALRRQKLEEIEFIFVDDRGRDDAMDKVRAAAKRDPRIRILTNPENAGAGVSRNAGIEAARGEYLAFVDADDYISPDFLSRLYALAKKEDLDIAKGGRVTLNEEGEILKKYPGAQNDEIRRSLYEDHKPIGLAFAYNHWTAIYRRSLTSDPSIRYGTTRRGEDTLFLLKIGHKAESIGFDDNAIYYYTIRTGSTSRTATREMIKDQIRSFEDKMDFLVETHPDPEDDSTDPYLYRYVRFQLQEQSRYASIPALEEAAAEFLTELRKQTLRLPSADIHKERHEELRVLLEEGKNIMMKGK